VARDIPVVETEPRSWSALDDIHVPVAVDVSHRKHSAERVISAVRPAKDPLTLARESSRTAEEQVHGPGTQLALRSWRLARRAHHEIVGSITIQVSDHELATESTTAREDLSSVGVVLHGAQEQCCSLPTQTRGAPYITVTPPRLK
jgi:hypothetical protein